VDDLVAFAREHPGKLRYSSPGNGSPTHLFMEKFKQAAGIDIQHIPYKGPSAHLAVVAGEVDLLLEGVQTMLPLVRAGRLKALAIGGTQRVPVLADVPTFEERGIKGIGYVWVGMVAPRGTPTAVIARLNSELHRVAALPAVREQHESVGRILAVSTPEEMMALIRGEIPLWREVVRVARIRAD
jgi:tripartite-type tricarboxylate transporter receptor subunit TctC